MRLVHLLVGALVLGGGVACGSGGDTVADDSCADLTVIGARGSGQAVDAAEPRGFGLEAGLLAQAVGEAASVAPYDWDTTFAGVDYPAVDVPTARADPAAFDASVRDGALAALDLATGAVATCPGTRLVVIGSSQGAVVAHGLASLLGAQEQQVVRERVLGIVLLGDPTRDRGDGDVEHADLRGVSTDDGFIATDVLDVAASLRGRVLSVCVQGDSVCASPSGATWADLVITPEHNEAYGEEVHPTVLGWLGSRSPLS
ncbi:cutinase family protein [Nocardioides sp.]|uniref:cutinase family protein n=1 Tax=Nocardioides sp. TaxID=35761 RepID=UPI00286BF430|nr:cutinase family protein [Nocardioides sp.]